MTALPGQLNTIMTQESDFRAALGENLFKRLGETVNFALVNAELSSIGTVKMAFLSQAQFQAQMGTTWVLMDGRSIVGSDLWALTGITQLTDARGTFIRSCDNGAGIDPAGVGPNSLEFDNLAYHNHTFTTNFGNTADFQGGPNATAPSSSQTSGRYNVGATFINVTMLPNINSGLETNPKNVTLNYFIKINLGITTT